MSIWLRSQDKKDLINANDVWIEGYSVYAAVNTSEAQYARLGTYNSETEAIKVLDMIEKYIGEVEYGRYGGNVIYPVLQMPEVDFASVTKDYRCVVCGVVPVDAEAGYDTCPLCAEHL